jgi:hypothetical protein
VRLCPGTYANILGGLILRVACEDCGYARFWKVTLVRRSVARVVSGMIVGEICDGKISQALNGAHWDVLLLLVREELPGGE